MQCNHGTFISVLISAVLIVLQGELLSARSDCLVGLGVRGRYVFITLIAVCMAWSVPSFMYLSSTTEHPVVLIKLVDLNLAALALWFHAAYR
jgi:hypothetical protein